MIDIDMPLSTKISTWYSPISTTCILISSCTNAFLAISCFPSNTTTSTYMVSFLFFKTNLTNLLKYSNSLGMFIMVSMRLVLFFFYKIWVNLSWIKLIIQSHLEVYFLPNVCFMCLLFLFSLCGMMIGIIYFGIQAFNYSIMVASSSTMISN